MLWLNEWREFRSRVQEIRAKTVKTRVLGSSRLSSSHPSAAILVPEERSDEIFQIFVHI